MENEEEIPLLEHEEKDDNDDEETTNPFQPGGSSTPGEDIPMTTMNREKEKDPYTDETSFIERSPLSRVLTSNAKAWETITREFPDAKATELEATYSKTGKLQVKMFGQGKKAYPLFTKDKDTGGQRLNPILPRQIKSALGTERENLIVQKEKEIEELQESIREDEEIANNENEQPSVRERAREKIAEKIEQIDALENERDELVFFIFFIFLFLFKRFLLAYMTHNTVLTILNTTNNNYNISTLTILTVLVLTKLF